MSGQTEAAADPESAGEAGTKKNTKSQDQVRQAGTWKNPPGQTPGD